MKNLLLFLLIAPVCCIAQPKLPSKVKKGKFSVPTTADGYQELRQQLKAYDSAYSFDAELVLSAKEQQLDRQLRRIQQQMLRHYDSISFFPFARYYYKSGKAITNNQLFEVLRRMPKGGIMHIHSSAMGAFEWMVQEVTKRNNCYVYWEDDGQTPKGTIRFFKEGSAPEGFTSGPMLQLQDPSFRDKLMSSITIDQRGDQDSVDVWTRFQTCFSKFGGFVSYAPLAKEFYSRALDEMIADNVQYMEIREGLAFGLYDLEHPPSYFTPEKVVQMWQELLREKQQQHPDFDLKLIYTNLRFFDKDVIAKDLAKAYALRKQYPDFVVGYDLVAEEDNGNTTAYFMENWVQMDSLEEVYGIDMPLCLHDGESSWPSSDNLFDAVMLRSGRIGHGFNLFRFPVLQQLVKKMDISIEVNPLSNQILGYIRDLRIHPAYGYMKQGIQISISPDDPAVFGYSGVTPDYWSVYLAWELDLQALKKLVVNSLSYTHMNAQEEAKIKVIWQAKWEDWVNWALEKTKP